MNLVATARGVGAWVRVVTMISERSDERVDCDGGFAAVFDAHHQRTVQLALLLCGDRHLAEEIVADAWVGVYRRLQRGPISDVGPYLRRAVVNKLRSPAAGAGAARGIAPVGAAGR